MCDSEELNDERLAEKFKQEFSEQFHILVRMHLSFVLDLNIDESDKNDAIDKGKNKKWLLLPSSRKNKAKSESLVLTQEVLDQIYQLIEFLRDERSNVPYSRFLLGVPVNEYVVKKAYCKVVGIFRISGSNQRQQKVRELLSQGSPLEVGSSDYNVHDCIAVFKQFLNQLPEPLLTEAHFPAYCQIAEVFTVNHTSTQETNKLLTALQLLMLLLPHENKTLFRDVIALFHHISTHKTSNNMPTENLAAVVTPNILTTKKHVVDPTCTKNLNSIMCFMIKNHRELFKIPPKLMLDFRARFEKKKLLRQRCLEESMTDQSGAASTVFTFVDQERTAKENEVNTTETALAQLYAHIQSLPESSRKRRLVNKFNKENGHGTPLQVLRSGPVPTTKNKSFGDSIKKHIFLKRKMPDLVQTPPTNSQRSQENQQQAASTTTPLTRTRLFCTKTCNESSSASETSSRNNILDESANREAAATVSDKICNKETVTDTTNDDDGEPDIKKTRDFCSHQKTQLLLKNKILVDKKDNKENQSAVNKITSTRSGCGNFSRLLTTSTPARAIIATGVHNNFHHQHQPPKRPDLMAFDTPDFGQHDSRKSMSPITRSAQKMPRAMQNVARKVRRTTPQISSSTSIISPPPASDASPAQTNTSRTSRSSILQQHHVHQSEYIVVCLPRMKETMMTPRSRKPVLLVSGTNINALASTASGDSEHLKQQPSALGQHKTKKMANLPEERSETDETCCSAAPDPRSTSSFSASSSGRRHRNLTSSFNKENENGRRHSQPDTTSSFSSLTSPFKDYLTSREMMTVANVSRTTTTTTSPSLQRDSSFSSRTDDFKSLENDSDSDSCNDDETSEDSDEVRRILSTSSRMTESLLRCLDGEDELSSPSSTTEDNNSDEDRDGEYQLQRERQGQQHQQQQHADETSDCYDDSSISDGNEKEPVLKPKQFDENGQPIVFETSF